MKRFLFVILILGLFGTWFVLPIDHWIESFKFFAKSSGFIGMFFFSLVYTFGVLFLPALPMTVVAGAVYGFWPGFFLSLISDMTGAIIAFLIARYFAQKKVETYLRKKTQAQRIRQAVEQEGSKVVLLMRLNPVVPFLVQNYLFGVTRIKLGIYFIFTLIGILPGTAIYTYLGSLGSGAAQSSPLKWIFSSLCIGIVCLTIWFIHKKFQTLMSATKLELKNEFS